MPTKTPDPWNGVKPIFVAGSPRSGNTWLLRLLSDFLSAPIRNVPPDYNTDARWCRDCIGHWVMVKSHWRRDQWNGEAAVFIHRDPRDVVISRLFVRDLKPRPDIITKIIAELGPENHGGYLAFVEAWLATDAPAVKYEELHDEGPAALARLSYELFAHMPTKAECEATFERVTFARCKKADPHFTRKGKVGDWKNYFKRQHGEQIDELLGEFMLEQHYTRGRDWWEKLPNS